MKKHFRSFVLPVLASALLVLVGMGCKNTAHGVGKDMEKAGEKIQDKTN